MAVDEDPWLGTIVRFPTVLHARASVVFSVGLGTLQRALFQALLALQELPRPVEVSVADRPGYAKGSARLEVGIGNQLGFDRLDPREEERLLTRIDRKGNFPTLDVALNVRYTIEDSMKHNVRRDRYVVRLVFGTDRAEILVHHVSGLRRLLPDQIIRMMVSAINDELVAENYSEVELESTYST